MKFPFWIKPVGYLLLGVVIFLIGWGVYKYLIGNHAVADAQLAKDYAAQKDSTRAWKESYKAVEDARRNLHDSLGILDGLLRVSHSETSKWHDTATAVKGRLLAAGRPAVTDSTSPKWMHRAIQLEQIVAAQDRELAGKDAELSIMNTKQKLLLSQMSKDSVSLHSANGNIDRLNKLVDQYKSKSECKIAWLLPCPSRTMAVVGGTAVGILGTLIVESSKPKK